MGASVEWLFSEIRKSDVERDVSTRGQFNTDDAVIESTLIRETIQNSLDAKISGTDGPVRMRISFFTPSGNEGFYSHLFEGLKPHLQASEMDTADLDFRKPTFLLFEDFATSGLRGKWKEWDEDDFFDFWKREGRSHKSGTSGGRHGLGKLVLSLSSRIRTFFGLTIRADDPGVVLLMGEAVLSNHKIGNQRYVPYGFFANEGAEGIQLPCHEPQEVARYVEAFGIQRKAEPGLSLVIPFPIQQVTKQTLIEGVLRNYFFPVLTGQLEVQVENETINADTFDSVASRFASNDLNPTPHRLYPQTEHRADSDAIDYIGRGLA